MEQLVVTLFCMYGIMFTLRSAQLPIVTQVRDFLTGKSSFFRKLFDCSFCTGFHAGWLTYILLNYDAFVTSSLVDNSSSLVAYSFMSATFCYALDTILVKMES